MARRKTHSLALRLKHLINWPSNARHPFLTKYIKHLFQGYLLAEPAIRSSANGLWINLTVLARDEYDSRNRQFGRTATPLAQHPCYRTPELDFSRARLDEAKGKLQRIVDLLQAQHPFYRDLQSKSSPLYTSEKPASLLACLTPSVRGASSGPAGAQLALVPEWRQLGIYQNRPIRIRYNVVRNPLVSAEVCAHYVAEQMGRGRSILAIKQDLMRHLG